MITPLQVKRIAERIYKEDGPEALTKENVCRAVGIPQGSLHHRTGLHFFQIVAYVNDKCRPRSKVPEGVKLSAPMRRATIMEAALKVARVKGFSHLKTPIIAKEANCSTASLHYHFGTVDKLRAEVMQEALKYLPLRLLRPLPTTRGGQILLFRPQPPKMWRW